MPDVRMQTLVDALGVPAPIGATLILQAYEGLSPAVHVEGDEVTFPIQVEKEFTGALNEMFALYVLPPGFYWRLIVSGPSYAVIRNVVLPAGSGPFDFADLVDVDPLTTLPDPALALADAFVAELIAIRDATLAAQAGVQFTQSTPLGSWVIAHGFGRVPAVAVYVGGALVIADITASNTTVTVAFAAPQSGYALLT